MKRFTAIALFCCIGVSLLSADTEVGRVVSLSGKVLIDAFGKGAFIPAIAGDTLYQGSVLQTESNGRAVVFIQGRQRDIPPAATVRIAEMLEVSARQSGLGWLQALGNLLRSVSEASRQKQEDLVLGSRAGEVGRADEGLGWMDEDAEAAELYAGAQADIRDQKYADALGRLMRVQSSSDQALLWNATFWKGFCYFQLEDYRDAVRYLAQARQMLGSAPAELGSPFTRRLLLFQLGASYYFLAEEKQATACLDAFLAERSGDQYEPYAVLFLAKALIASGDPRRAKSVLIEARARYKGQDIDTEFARLLAGL
jgi:tetratricopeptide (TPR) repeat protein